MEHIPGCRIVLENGVGQIEEKKSKFIASIFSIKTEEEVAGLLEQVRKKYWDARHHCRAYIIGESENPVMHCSDDGEPAQTAGKPMLNVLLGERLHNVLAIVTRYFGGTLLGTGGLVRAYSAAVQEGLKNSILVEKYQGFVYQIKTDYSDFGKLSYLCGQRKIFILNTEYTDSVVTHIMLPAIQEQEFLKKLIETTNARAIVEKMQDMPYALHDNELILFKENGSVWDRIHSQSL